MGSSFSSNQYEMSYADDVEFHYWTAARSQILSTALKKIGFSGVGLDVGCGRGIDVLNFRRDGFNFYGVEVGNPDPYFPESEGILFLGQDSFSLNSELREQIEILTFLDVLEHIENPLAFLKKHRELYPNLKWIVVTLPARQEIFSNYDVYFGHHKRYSLQDCNYLFFNNEIVQSQYFFHLLYWPALLFKFLGIKRNIKITPPSNRSVFLRTLHKMLSKYFIWEAKVLPKRIYGSSILCIVKI